MNKFFITLSTLSIFDLFYLLRHAIDHINKNPELAAKDFTPEGLLKIKSVEKQLNEELFTEVKLGQHRNTIN